LAVGGIFMASLPPVILLAILAASIALAFILDTLKLVLFTHLKIT
jgi:hypothetical protein